MDEIDELHLIADLSESFCELNHGPQTIKEDFPASDYIIVPFGYKKDEVIDVAAREMVIPICSECAMALLGNDWTLIYCFECNSSQWVYRKMAKNKYRHNILWLRGCIKCNNEFGGLYFNDSIVSTELNFLSNGFKQ